MKEYEIVYDYFCRVRSPDGEVVPLDLKQALMQAHLGWRAIDVLRATLEDLDYVTFDNDNRRVTVERIKAILAESEALR